jgi:hypothetical protein
LAIKNPQYRNLTATKKIRRIEKIINIEIKIKIIKT